MTFPKKKIFKAGLAVFLFTVAVSPFLNPRSTHAAPSITPYQLSVLQDRKSGYSRLLASSSGDALVLSTPYVQRYGKDGTLKETYTIPYEQNSANRYRVGLLEDPSNNIWLTTNESRTDSEDCTGGVIKLNKISPDGVFSQYTILEETGGCGDTSSYNLTLGSDGNLWVGVRPQYGGPQESRFIVVSPSGDILHDYSIGPQEDFGPVTLVGSDGNLWFTVQGKMGKITADGSDEYFELDGDYTPSVIASMVLGPDGKIWFGCVNQTSRQAGICRIDAQGNLSTYPLELNAWVTGLTMGPDGKIWFAGIEGLDFSSNTFSFTSGVIGTIDPSGVIAKYQLPDGPNGPTFAAQISGSAKALWAFSINFTDQSEDAFTHPIIYLIGEGSGNPEPGEGPAPQPPRTGRLAVATLVAISMLSVALLLARTYQKKFHKIESAK